MEEIRITQISKSDLADIIKTAVNDVVSQLPKIRKKPYTKTETKELFQVSYPTLKRWESKSLLKRIEIAGRVYYTANSVEGLFSTK